MAKVGGRSLLDRAIDVGRASDRIDLVAVSTDDDEMAAVARARSVEVIRRPPLLATDAAPMVEVVAHALEKLRPTDLIVLLQPTSPLRRVEHVDAVVDLALETGADTVVTVTRVPHQFSPPSLFRREGDHLVRADPDTPRPTRRQDKPELWAPNGPAVLAVRPATVRAGSLYGERVLGVEMTMLDSIDVDDADDLWLADVIAGARE